VRLSSAALSAVAFYFAASASAIPAFAELRFDPLTGFRLGGNEALPISERAAILPVPS
jgi:hypothetical protein